MFSKAAPLSSRGLIALIVGITVLPLGTLLWLGWRLLDQDRALERQQMQERLESAADLAAAALQRAISLSEQRLAAGGGQWPEGSVTLTFHEDYVDAYPANRIAWLPVMPGHREAPAATFARGEELEFHQQDHAGAIREFRELSKSADSTVRAEALLRLARNLKSDGRIEEALAAYSELSELQGVWAGSAPAGLAARYARCQLFEERHRAADLHLEAGKLAADLRSARWPLTSAMYWLYSEDAAKWTGETSHEPREAEIFADAAATLWEKRKQMAGSGRETLRIGGQTLTVVWQTLGAAQGETRSAPSRILLAEPNFVDSQWLAAAAPVAEKQHVILGTGLGLGPGSDSRNSGARRDLRSAADTGLPWSIVVSAQNPAGTDSEFVMRRRLLIAGFLLLVSMALTASYVIVRAVRREAAVARLQSDFVAAVSHEFRTPLTALRQFTDMLRGSPGQSGAQPGALSDERRRICYEAQSRATDRLTRLIESLLDFGRMEAGARLYRFERRDCSEVVQRTVEDFRGDLQAEGYKIEFHGNGPAEIEVDGEALARAVRNLLENAVKYSPDRRSVEVRLNRRDENVRIAVRDHGIGIPANERTAIFAKFQRGEQARTRGIKGTGIGLSMVDEIVKAHHGRVEVESEPGKGSTFTIVLSAKDWIKD